MKRAIILCLAAGVLIASQAVADTWLEPFHAEVVAEADTLVAATIDRGNRLRVDRVLAGQDPGARVEVATIGAIELEPGARVYAWVERNGDSWTVPTPTSSIRPFLGEHVVGTFRISCAGALYEPALFERLQIALFEVLHGGSDTAHDVLASFVREELSRPAEYFGGEGDPTAALGFFRQIAALELLATDASLMPGLDLALFLASDDFHLQISAVRALAAREGSTDDLLDVLESESTHVVPMMVAARLLRGRELDYVQQRRLVPLAESASGDEVALCGGSIMDPRVVEGYDVSPRDAIRELLR